MNGNARNPTLSGRRISLVLLMVAGLVGCAPAAGPAGPPPAQPAESQATATPAPSPAPPPADYAFPSEIDPGARYLIYLHGKIIEDQGLPAISPEYGEYRYEDILEALRSYGFVVVSEVRPGNTDAAAYATRVAAQVSELIEAGIPAGSISVVGASKGAAIAMIVSHLVKDPGVNYVLLGGCNTPTVEELTRQGVTLSGNVLSIYDSADASAGSCEDLLSLSAGTALGRHEELVLDIGTGHGILYEPLPEWVVPTARWADPDG